MQTIYFFNCYGFAFRFNGLRKPINEYLVNIPTVNNLENSRSLTNGNFINARKKSVAEHKVEFLVKNEQVNSTNR